MQILRFSSALLGWLILTVFTVPAFAHVSITPRTAQTGVRHVRHIIRAPVEKGDFGGRVGHRGVSGMAQERRGPRFLGVHIRLDPA